jgi:uncharacterized protein
MDSAYDRYRQLVARVEAFGDAVRQRYPGQVTCQAGCDGCCYQQFTIFPVEAYHLRQTVMALSPQERQGVWQHLQQQETPWWLVDQPQPCALLDNGRCRLYAGRPLICRMHGYPLYSRMIERPDGGQRDCCPLNFPAVPLSTMAPQAVYNLDLVHHTLAAINHLFAQEGAVPDQRVTIRHAALQALNTLGIAEAEETYRGQQG